MLIKFSVSNYLSFKDAATFDLSAEALKERKDFVHVPYLYSSKLALLKSAAIYGHNAFGKSNFIKSYATFRHIILNSFKLGSNNSEFNIEPFRLNTAMLEKPSFFEATFIIRQTKYRYGYEISKQKVISEWLYYAEGGIRENPLYIRAEQDYREISKSWNKTSEKKVEQAKLFTKPYNLFLTVLLSQEGIPHIDEISSWFQDNIILHRDYDTDLSGAVRIYTNEEYRSIILKFLAYADLGFTNIFEKVSNLIKNKSLQSDIANILYDIEMTNFELYTHHKVYDENYVYQKTIEFDLLKNESAGSIKYFVVSCYLAYALKKGQLVLIDELDARFDSNLLVFLIETFNSEKNNINGTQLLFTAHNTVLLDNNLRRDQIWLMEKNEYGESSLHKGHTPEMPIRINKSVEQDYRAGKLKKGVSSKVNKNNLPSLFGEDEV